MLSFKQFLIERSPIYNPLKHNDLTKRGDFTRLDNFINKIRDGDYFLTLKGSVKLDKTQVVNGKKVNPEVLRSEMDTKGFSATFTGSKEKGGSIKLRYPSDFLKTPEFGGKGKGFAMGAEDAAIAQVRNELQRAMDATKKPYVNINMNGRTERVVDVVSTPGMPKSDFHLVDEMGNEVFWISHKAGSNAKAFQQYGGLIELMKTFPGNKDIQKFVDDVSKKTGGALDRGMSFARPVTDKKLIMASIYGIEYGKKPSRQNVDVLLQGSIKLKKKGRNFTLDSQHTQINGDMPKGGYTPTFFVRYTGDRGNFGVGNSRFMIAPEAYADRHSKKDL